jgi:hypothetical protein
VLDAEICGRPSKLNGKKVMDISDPMLQSPSKSLRKWARDKNIGLSTAHKAFRDKLNFSPYKVTEVQELKSTDHEKRIRYCECLTSLPTPFVSA